MSRLRWGPSAFVLSAIALFVALGGTGYALTQADSAPPASLSAPPRTAPPAWHNLTLTGGWTYAEGGTHTTPATTKTPRASST